MRRAGLAILAALLALAVVAALRERSADAPRTGPAPPPVAAESVPLAPPGPAAVSGVVTGRYGPIAGVAVEARAGGEIVSRASSDSMGRYRLDVPSEVDLEIEALPVPETELLPALRMVRLAALEEAAVDFELARGGRASGVVRFAGRDGCLDVVAIRVEDYPPGPEPVPIGALAAAPKLGARMTVVYGYPPSLDAGPEDGHAFALPDGDAAFEFRGLDPFATYRLAVLDRRWTIDPPVVFRAGDAVSARAEPALRIYVEATDVETREPVRTFFAALVDGAGAALDSFEGADGRISRSLPRSGDGLTLVISAEGYREERRPADGVHRVALRRSRPPNVVLRLAHEDGMPCAAGVEAQYEALDDPDGLLDAEVREEAPGRLLLSLPAGKWRLHVKRPRAFQDVTRIADLDVPAEGTAEATIRYPRGGTVTFEDDMTIERDVEGEWQMLWAEEGTWDDVPPGTYRVMRGGEEHARFEVGPGTIQSVRKPPAPKEPAVPDLELPDGE